MDFHNVLVGILGAQSEYESSCVNFEHITIILRESAEQKLNAK